MKKILWEITRNIKFVILSIVFIVMLQGAYIYSIKDDYQFFYKAEAWEMASQIACVLLPLLVSAVTCIFLYQEKRCGFFKYVACREDIKKYINRKYLVAVLYGFSIGFLGSLIIFIYCQIGFAKIIIETNMANNNYIITHFMGDIYVKYPWIYAIGLSIWRGIIGALYGYSSCIIAMHANQMFVALLGCFAWVTVTDFVLAIFDNPQFTLSHSYVPETLTSSSVNFVTMSVSVVVTLGVVLLFKYFMEKKHEIFD